MTERRQCRYRACKKLLPVTARRDAEFCDERCRSKEKYERRKEDAANTRVTAASGTHSTVSGDLTDLSGVRNRPLLKEPFDRDRILTALKARGPAGIHSHEIRKLGLSGHPSMRISELEERGYEIEHLREHKGRRPGVRYVLVSEPVAVTEAKAA